MFTNSAAGDRARLPRRVFPSSYESLGLFSGGLDRIYGSDRFVCGKFAQSRLCVRLRSAARVPSISIVVSSVDIPFNIFNKKQENVVVIWPTVPRQFARIRLRSVRVLVLDPTEFLRSEDAIDENIFQAAHPHLLLNVKADKVAPETCQTKTGQASVSWPLECLHQIEKRSPGLDP